MPLGGCSPETGPHFPNSLPANGGFGLCQSRFIKEISFGHQSRHESNTTVEFGSKPLILPRVDIVVQYKDSFFLGMTPAGEVALRKTRCFLSTASRGEFHQGQVQHLAAEGP